MSNGLLQDLLQLRSLANSGGENVAIGGSLGDAGIIRRRVKGNVNLLVGRLGAQSLGMDEEQRPAWGVPAYKIDTQR